jgi:hypothetical protein
LAAIRERRSVADKVELDRGAIVRRVSLRRGERVRHFSLRDLPPERLSLRNTAMLDGVWKTRSIFERCNIEDEDDLREATELIAKRNRSEANQRAIVSPISDGRAARPVLFSDCSFEK